MTLIERFFRMLDPRRPASEPEPGRVIIQASMVRRFDQLVPGEYFVLPSSPDTLMQCFPNYPMNCIYVHNGIPSRLLPPVPVIPVTVTINFQ